VEDYEDVSRFTLDPAEVERLLGLQNECVFIWRTKDGWPVGIVMSYVWKDAKLWLTSSGQRPRVPAVRRDPRVSVVVSGSGTPMGATTVTIKGKCEILADSKTREWFYAALAQTLVPDSEASRQRFIQRLDSPRRVVMCVTPEKFLSFSLAKMGRFARGGDTAG
jgi:general stress protein 26